jgi:hypothetical protein
LPIGPSVAAAGTPTVADAAPDAAAPADISSQAAASSAPGTPGVTDGAHAAPASPGAAAPGDPSPQVAASSTGAPPGTAAPAP